MRKTMTLQFALAAMTCGAAILTETEIEMPTYPFSDPDPTPATTAARYPYFFFDGTTATNTLRKWKAVVLENERIKVTILPEIGGKIWGATDKTTGRDFIYHNHVVKFRNIAQRGPWCSGGIEFNFGIIGHAPSTATPVAYFCRTNTDGSASCFLSDTELICRTTWQVEVRLADNADLFTTRTTWFNGSNFCAPYYHWMNAAYSVRGDPEFFFPSTAYIGHNGDAHAWPIDDKGRNLARYAENAFGRNKSYHVLNGDNSFYGIWWSLYGIGAFHENDVMQKYGRKIWLWALSREGGIWEDLLTDSDGQYAELQSGRCFNQPRDTLKTPFKHTVFAPGATETFEEKWGVVRSRAALEGRMDPNGAAPRPVEMQDGFDWTSAYGLYLKGRDFIRRRMDRDGEKALNECLAKEPQFVPALERLASLAVRRGKYADAHGFAQRVLAVDTYSPEANYADGQAFLAECDFHSARERLGLAAFSPVFRTSALALAARIDLDPKRAEEALLANKLNLDAWLVKLAAARRRGRPDAAAARRILEHLPLFHAARYELNLADPSSEPMERYVRCEMPHEVYLETGTWYEDARLFADAEFFFRKAAAATPVGGIRLAYILHRAGRDADAKAALDATAAQPVAFAMPFRRESLPALRWAARTRGEWKFKYLAAVCLAANAQDAEADALLAECRNEPDDAVFYLYRASRRTGAAHLADLMLAKSAGDSWRVGRALCRHFESGNDWRRMLQTAKEYNARFPGRNPLQIAYATALLRNGRARESMDYLENLTILPSEFGGSATEVWQEAQKALGLEPTWPENLGKGKPFDDCPAAH